ncbi:MAG: hypothetical protein A2174_00270 [Candidatus Portnoybacteria bacterium RBG_13_41_18]|uniref:Uncharacterized protein n=1 Tax=Candidatus Portnoybacteria bacterium RBG_13_41_18 TaxID=1801991 RepID=A0A1G2F9Z6_9BACT|nr:MAG: hypothetical protein A2174_00270 [Candidatus Portnoybacteria bacterium RBG_13_41_18]
MGELEKNEDRQKRILEALREVGYEARLNGGCITVTTKGYEPLSRDELIKLALIMRNHDFPVHFQHPKSCIIVTDNRGIIMEMDGRLFIFSNQEKFREFKKKYGLKETKIFLHELKWEIIMKKLSSDFKEAILDYDGNSDPDGKPVYNIIPLIESSEIGGMA